MSPELEQKLTSDFPELFKGRSKPNTESLMCYGCEHSDGWFNIIHSMCHAIESHLKRKDPRPEYEFVQIKEKFGTLRVYDNGHDEYIAGVTRMAENMSAFTCEVTGNPGSMCRKGFWYRTLCEEQAEKDGYFPAGKKEE
jgi:hypothetical protein